MNIFKALSITFVSLIATQALAGPVNINTANAEQLDVELNGVGPVIAERIVEHRQTRGNFQSAQELMLVKGVGEKTFSKNAEFILLK